MISLQAMETELDEKQKETIAAQLSSGPRLAIDCLDVRDPMRWHPSGQIAVKEYLEGLRVAGKAKLAGAAYALA
jgi:hypothetical protein